MTSYQMTEKHYKLTVRASLCRRRVRICHSSPSQTMEKPQPHAVAWKYHTNRKEEN